MAVSDIEVPVGAGGSILDDMEVLGMVCGRNPLGAWRQNEGRGIAH